MQIQEIIILIPVLHFDKCKERKRQFTRQIETRKSPHTKNTLFLVLKEVYTKKCKTWTKKSFKKAGKYFTETAKHQIIQSIFSSTQEEFFPTHPFLKFIFANALG